MVSLLERTSRAALDLLFPPRCALCRTSGSMLCDGCVVGLPRASGERCIRCWTPLARTGVCQHCAASRDIPFTSIRTPFVMEEGARELVHQLKYGGMSALGEPMGKLMPLAAPPACDAVVPVPLHRGRLRARGYNQAALLARVVASAVSMPLDENAVRRTRATKPLARSMHREERRAIVAGAFVASRDHVAGRRVLLVDDVVTTGATLDACAGALLAAGAVSIRCVAFARAD